jgi:hypothetical protein
MSGSAFTCDCAGAFTHVVGFRGRMTTRTKFVATERATGDGARVIHASDSGDEPHPWSCPCRASYHSVVKGRFYGARLSIYLRVRGHYETTVRVRDRDGKLIGTGSAAEAASAPFTATFKAKLK